MNRAYEPRIARVAALVADPARSRMLCRLLAGDHATAGELARVASVTPATASGHLAKLVDAGLVVGASRGRHRYFRLADSDVAHALEALALVADRGEHLRTWAQPGRQALRAARSCYGHLAGALGVRLHRTLLQRACLVPDAEGLALTSQGVTWLRVLGMAAPEPAPARRYAYACMDWSERRDHLAGLLAESMLRHFLEQGWLCRREGRVIELTPAGRLHLLPHLAPDER